MIPIFQLLLFLFDGIIPENVRGGKKTSSLFRIADFCKKWYLYTQVIRDLCRKISSAMEKGLKKELTKLGILIVYLFGSMAIGGGSQLSDVDIGVVCKDPMQDKDTRFLYNRLYELFSDLYPHSRLDIVFLQTAPLALQFFAIKDGKVVFEEDPRYTADYENRVIQQYLDFRSVLDFFDRIAAERYAKT